MIVVQDSSAALPGVSQYLYVLCSHVIPEIITGRNASGFIFRAIVSSTSPTYAVLLQHLHLHYPAGKNHVANHFVDGIKMKDTVDVFVMDGSYYCIWYLWQCRRKV